MTRWSFRKLTKAMNWQTENILTMRFGGATEDEIAVVRAGIEATIARSGWTYDEWWTRLTRRLDKDFARREKAKLNV